MYRPGHADKTWEDKFGFRDHRGGGRSSARTTASAVIGGAIARQVLVGSGIRVTAFVSAVGKLKADPAKLDLAENVAASGQELSITRATVRLTAEGAAAFNGDTDRGTYVAGEEMDPLYVQATVTGCELGEIVAVDQPSGSAEDTTVTPISAAPEAEPAVPSVPIIIGGVALIVIGIAAGMLIAGRGKGGATPPPRTQD